LHYLAITPVLFPEVPKQLNATGCAKEARIVIEKPFGRDLASAHALNEVVHDVFPEQNVFRIDHLFETH
jgi:glucose-6-phosphate 1-dehydrogenase